MTPSLRPQRQYVVFEHKGDDQALFSPSGPLTRDELDLIDIQFNSALVHMLVPQTPKDVGDSWIPTNETLALLLNLEAVNRSDVVCNIGKHEGQLVVIDLAGSLTGAIDGVATEIELKARCNYHRKHRQVIGLAMALKEKREIGQVQPGFDVIAQLRMVINPVSSSTHLAKGAIAGLPVEQKAGSTLLEHRSTSGYELLHDRKWHVIAEEAETSVLRYVDGGDRIAHCNVTKLTKLPAGKTIELKTFAGDIEKSLGDSFQQIVEATQARRDNGYHIMRVVATGQAAQIPIQWIFFHITSPSGQRASIGFTMETAMVERFGNAGGSLVSSFQFTAPETARRDVKKAASK